MNIKKQKSNSEDLIIPCTHCKVCSLKLSADEIKIIEDGQQMIEVCQVCGKEVTINAENTRH